MRSSGSRTAAVAGAGLALLLLAPLYWMTAGSLMPESRLFQAPPLLPRQPSLDHYRALFDERDFLIPLRNSLVVAGATTAVVVPIAALCAYALARLRFRGRGVLLAAR